MTPEQEKTRYEFVIEIVDHALEASRQGLTNSAFDNLMTYITWTAIPEIASLCDEDDGVETGRIQVQ